MKTVKTIIYIDGMPREVNSNPALWPSDVDPRRISMIETQAYMTLDEYREWRINRYGENY